MKFLIVGAGFTGAVMARELAEDGHVCEVIDSRPYVGGNCYTERDPETGIMIHVHGPHIFHTDNEEVWAYVNRFGDFRPYRLQVRATTGNRVYSLPINLHTINQFFNAAMRPVEARAYLDQIRDQSADQSRSFEDVALGALGPELYEAFFKGYPIKQWGIHPRELPASVLKRLPIRFNYDDNYFFHSHQGIPTDGYTSVVTRILDHPRISVTTSRSFVRDDATPGVHVVYTGAIDDWFGHDLGRLGYRTLDFKRSVHDGDYQGCAVMNYPEEEVPFTRVSEHKHFAPWEKFEKTVVFHEYSRAHQPGDIHYYPIRLVEEKAQLRGYVERARNETGVTFAGRLGTYRYLDMDVSVAEALTAGRGICDALRRQQPIPAFFADPLK